MIRLVCPNCKSKLSAKEKLLGQTRNCPKCGEPVLISLPDPASQLADEEVSSEPVYDLSQPVNLDESRAYRIDILIDRLIIRSGLEKTGIIQCGRDNG